MEALHDWHEFYFMLGSSAAALMALLFVAVSIGIGYYTERNVEGVRTFLSPVVAHFTAVLFVGAMALAPVHGKIVLIALILAGFAGALVAAYTSKQIFRFMDDGAVVPFDTLAYGFIPFAAYVVIAGSGVLLELHWEWAPELLAGAVLTLMLVNIRNAWDLMLSVVRRQSHREKRKRKA
jgi:hypothetical protein